MSTSEASYSNKLNCGTFTSTNSDFFFVWLKYGISPNVLQIIKFYFTDISEVSSKLSYFLTYLANCNRFYFDNSTRNPGLLFSTKSMGNTFFKMFLLKYRYFTSFCKTSNAITFCYVEVSYTV